LSDACNVKLNLDSNRHRELAAWMWNNGGAQMTAALAMGVVVLAVVVSVQPGSILKDLIAGFGAAGQVFFAGMVWKLGQRQFEFTKSMSAEQNRINLLPHRQIWLADIDNIHSSLSKSTSGSSDIELLDTLVRKSRTLFSDATYNLILDYAASARNVKQIEDVADIFVSHGNPGNLPAYFQYKTDVARETSDRWTAAHEAVIAETNQPKNP
jgi:hypothetical protein